MKAVKAIFSLFSPAHNPLALFVYSFLLVFTSYNVWNHSIWHWLTVRAADFQAIWTEYVLVVVGTIVVWGVFLRAAHGSMKWYGAIATATIVGLVTYLPFKWGWLSTTDHDVVVTMGQVGIALAIGFASTFSRLWYALFRQRSVDTVEGDTIAMEDDDHYHGDDN